MAGKTKKKLTVTQMRSVIKFLIGVNIVLLITVIVLSVLLAVSRSKSGKDAVWIRDMAVLISVQPELIIFMKKTEI